MREFRSRHLQDDASQHPGVLVIGHHGSKILDLTSRFMRDALRILVIRLVDVEGTHQVYMATQRGILGNVYEMWTIIQGIIYCNTRQINFQASQMGKRDSKIPRCTSAFIHGQG